jgi:hypothetical protein
MKHVPKPEPGTAEVPAHLVETVSEVTEALLELERAVSRLEAALNRHRTVRDVLK